MKSIMTRLSMVAMIGLASVELSGCIVAAVPLIMAAGAGAVAITGFVVYKSVQTAEGGNVKIAFGSSDPKHPSPPRALPKQTAVAVLAGGERERRFASVIKTTSKIQASVGDPSLQPRTAEERNKAYEVLCQRMHVGLVAASVDEGQTVSSNMLSFKRGAATQKLSLEGYGCATHAVIWTDTMAVVVEAGRSPTPQAEIDDIAGQAWAERVLLATTLS